MLHGLVHDSAVIGTVKHAQHALKVTAKKARHEQGVIADIQDLVDGINEIKKIMSGLKRKNKKSKK